MRSEQNFEASPNLTGHKFKPLSEQLLKSLEASEIYFASPAQLNDPFDCQIDLRLARALALSSLGGSTSSAEDELWGFISAILAERLKTCGVFSLCGGEVIGPNSHLFWPHYGDNHEGVCLTYSIPESFVIEQQIGVGPVNYTPDSLYKALVGLKLSAVSSNDEMQETIISLLTTKSKAWSYEDEFRLVSYIPGPQKIPKEWLKQVCFGLRVGEAERQCLMESLHKWGYAHCTFAEVLKADDQLFGFALNELFLE